MPADLVDYVTTLTRSADPLLAGQARERLDALKAEGADLVKFDPGEARDVTGQWTAGGDHRSTTVTNTTTPAQRRAARQQAQADAATQRQNARNQRAADTAQVANLRAKLGQAKTPKPPKGQAAAAVAAARKEYVIPTGKKFTRLSSARQQAATQILDGTRAAVLARNAQTKAQARLAAIEALAGQQGLSDKAKAWLVVRGQRAQAALAAAGQQLKAANNELAAGRRTWGHPRSR